jgi:acetoin utilization deacetylase AcuC-like enzyme
MKILFNSKFLEHNHGSYAEGPYRIRDFQGETGEVDRDGEKYITLVHSKSYLDHVRDACRMQQLLAEVNLSPGSYQAACSAVGLAVMAAEQGDFAVVRPPGHHAKPERADGFCLFNNLAIAVRKLVGEGKKVFILDIDGHHGDGTQQIFYDTDRVLYCSMHQQYAYPWTGEADETGSGKGFGFTMNFPLPAGSGDRELLEAVEIALEKALNFNPDAVAVSAGFDGYRDDRLLDLNYSLDGFYQCGYRLRRSFSHIFALLEGGYHADIRKCVDQFIGGVNDAAGSETSQTA